MVQEPPELILVFVTCASAAQAAAISQVSVEARLAACATIAGPVQSRYWWQGKVESASETQLLLKTSRALFPALAEQIRRLHSYENPEIVAVPLVEAAPLYRDWLMANLRSTA